jgi:hypothetical protein
LSDIKQNQMSYVNRRRVLQGLLASTYLLGSPLQHSAIAEEVQPTSLIAAPSIVVRSTENIVEGSWVWLLNAARDAGIGRIYLLVKQDENNFASDATGRTLRSGEMLAPVADGSTAEGWGDPSWLDEFLVRAESYGIEVHAWWPCFQDAIGASKMPNAGYAGEGNDIFLDPARAEVCAYETKLLQALLQRYPFKGVALDWLRYNDRPNGAKGPLAERFHNMTGIEWSKEAMAEPLARATWDDLRARTVAKWVSGLLTDMRTRHADVKWSAFVLPWMFKEVAQSYRHLSDAGLDSLQPMIYWRDWKENVDFVSDVISPAPFYLSGRTTLDPTFDITDDVEHLTKAVDYLPADRLGRITWYHNGVWAEEDFQKLKGLTENFNKARTALYARVLPVLAHLPFYNRLAPAAFPPDSNMWAVVCLGELYRRKTLDFAEPVIPVLGFHRFVEGELESGPSVWHASSAYIDSVIALLKTDGFTVMSVDTLAAYMTSEDKNLLPDRPLVITIDDGSASVFNVFEPRAKAANLHYTAAIVTSWMSNGTGQEVEVGDGLKDINLTWEEAETLHKTGRVSLISHSHEQHRWAKAGVSGTDQGPAIPTRLWNETDQRLESDGERLRRVFDDLTTSRALLAKHFGKASRFLAWPYGLHDDSAEAAAVDAGFTHFFEFGGNALAAPRKKPHRIMRLSIMKMDEAVPLKFPDDAVTQQRWWLAFLRVARATMSNDLIAATLLQIDEEHAAHPEVEMSHAAQLILNGHAGLAQRRLAKLRGLYPHDGPIHASVDEFDTVYKELA